MARDWKGDRLIESITYIHIACPLTMESNIHQFYIVDWTLLPHFLCEGIHYFPFKTTAEAQVFSDLLVSRIRGSLVRAPTVNESSEKIAHFISRLDMEMLGEYRISPPCPFISLFIQLGPSLSAYASSITSTSHDPISITVYGKSLPSSMIHRPLFKNCWSSRFLRLGNKILHELGQFSSRGRQTLSRVGGIYHFRKH